MPPLESRKSANNLHMLAEVVTIEGQLSAQAIEDPSAPPLPLQGEATPGDVVAASVETDAAGARVRIVLAPAGSLKAKFYRIVIQHGLDPLYPDAVHRETHELDIESMLSDPDLEDLDHLPFVTIDNRDSRDLDQALFIERNNRDYIVWYALADAAAFVRPGSALFEEALRRGSSFYLPGLTLPMLPRRLSEDWISLNENRCRRAFVFKMEIDSSGLCRNTRLHRARIRSRKKLSYPRVQRAWDDPGGSGFSRQPFQESLELLREVGRLRLAEAKSRHVVQYNRREVEVIPADDELGFAIIRRQRLEVESCNEQISLLCNIEGARLLVQGRGLAHVQPIFRVHPAPSADRLEKLEALIASLVEAHQLDVQRWVWQGSSEPLADFLDRLPRKARPRIAAVIDRHALLTNHRSMFTQKPAPHFGVGATVYARFSSPMREVVGIFTHKEALELLGDAETAAPTSDDVILRDAVAKAGNRSKNLQRLLTKEAHLLALDSLLSKDLQQSSVDRPLRRGTLMGMKPSLLYVRLDDPPLEIKLHLKDLEKLTGERWRPDDLGAILRPPHGVDRKTLRLGDAVDLRLAGYDEKQRRWLFQM